MMDVRKREVWDSLTTPVADRIGSLICELVVQIREPRDGSTNRQCLLARFPQISYPFNGQRTKGKHNRQRVCRFCSFRET